MNQDLRIPLNPFVKLLVRHRRLVDANLVRNDKRWLGLARDDQVTQVPIVSFDVALAGAEGEALYNNQQKDNNG